METDSESRTYTGSGYSSEEEDSNYFEARSTEDGEVAEEDDEFQEIQEDEDFTLVRSTSYFDVMRNVEAQFHKQQYGKFQETREIEEGINENYERDEDIDMTEADAKKM